MPVVPAKPERARFHNLGYEKLSFNISYLVFEVLVTVWCPEGLAIRTKSPHPFGYLLWEEMGLCTTPT
jgi:hypothetical protein